MQPMDQWIISSLIRSYRVRVLRHILLTRLLPKMLVADFDESGIVRKNASWRLMNPSKISRFRNIGQFKSHCLFIFADIYEKQ